MGVHVLFLIFSFFKLLVNLRCLEMEKEKEISSSPRGVLEACIGTMAPRKTSSQVRSTEIIAPSSTSVALSNWRKFFKLWKGRSFKRLVSFPPFSASRLSRMKVRNDRESTLIRDIHNFQISLQNFTLFELETATNNFSQGLYIEFINSRSFRSGPNIC